MKKIKKEEDYYCFSKEEVKLFENLFVSAVSFYNAFSVLDDNTIVTDNLIEKMKKFNMEDFEDEM